MTLFTTQLDAVVCGKVDVLGHRETFDQKGSLSRIREIDAISSEVFELVLRLTGTAVTGSSLTAFFGEKVDVLWLCELEDLCDGTTGGCAVGRVVRVRERRKGRKRVTEGRR